MARLVVISGPAGVGKMKLARVLMARDPSLALVSRDALRDALACNGRDEMVMTLLMVHVARFLLGHGIGAVVHACNLEEVDRVLWRATASEAGIALEWIELPAAWERIDPRGGAS